MKLRYVISLIFLFSGMVVHSAFAQLQSPAEYLGYDLGDRYTPHHKVMDYARHVAENSDRAILDVYGETYENRELVHLVVTSPGNHQNLEEIRTNNLKLTGLMDGEPTDMRKAIVWLSYNIHGNETSSSEAAMKTLYQLTDPGNSEAAGWLENTVVVVDPMINPDGRERYVNWFRGITGSEYDPNVESREHDEPWPGGRSNHYYFDLNRDWAWQTQQESQARAAIYKEWMPHVHVDFHEQGYNSPYYFAPAAEPFHEAITDWQREFQTTIGENHTSYFDEEGWLYFTKQRFDLFYPSYGDTWPTFNGAIGMTYEQAGGSAGGAAVLTEDGDTLTLKDRLTHHTVTGISTVEVTANNAERVVSEFESHFNDAVENPAGQYKTYVVRADNDSDKIYNLLTFLDNQQIRYGRAGDSERADGYNYSTGVTERFSVEENDIIISAYQPQSQLARVFFEPDPALSDSLTYDITAWEAHYRFGLSGYATESRIDPEEELSADEFWNSEYTGADEPYAYITEWGSMNDARFLAEITKMGVNSRFSTVPFQIDGKEFERGTLVVTRASNKSMGARFDQIVREAATKHGRSLHGAASGYVQEGADFGSSDVTYIEKPVIAVFMGDGTSSLAAGEAWHFFDQQLNYPVTLFHTQQFGGVDVDEYNTIVMPSGYYSDMLNESGQSKLVDWVRSGGKLIAIDGAVSAISGMDAFQISRKSLSDEESDDDESKLRTYDQSSRMRAMSSTPGSIFRTTLDHTHPLAYGYGSDYYSLKTDATAFEYLDSGWNVGTIQTDAHMSGFAGQLAKQNLEGSLTYGVQSVGSGDVVYMVDNPLFRGFWEDGKLLMVNALFFVGQ
jgi:hypothetical protein